MYSLSWRERVLKELIPNLSAIHLTADPDNLLTDEQIQMELRKRGFNLVVFDDVITFRYLYETQYRNNDKELIVIVHKENIDNLPYDILSMSRQHHFSLAELFPNLSYPVVAALDQHYLDALYTSQQKLQPTRMGENATAAFILQYVFEITPELINDKVSLLKCLLRCHYGNMKIPAILQRYLIKELRNKSELKTWPVASMIEDAKSFYSFLQEQWPAYLLQAHSSMVHEKPDTQYTSFRQVPFEHEDIRIYIDNLFLEGYLEPINLPGVEMQKDEWIRCGLSDMSILDRENKLYDLIDKSLPDENNNFETWRSFALKWAKLNAFVHTNTQTDKKRYDTLWIEIDKYFSQWMNRQYLSLYNMPSSQVAMLHHIPKFLARRMEENRECKVALLVIDGLALNQFETLQQMLAEQLSDAIIQENATFAWVPTTTSVSRQTIFSGKMPLFFADSIHTTSKESKLWEQFWEDQGLTKAQIVYAKGWGTGDPDKDLYELLTPGKTKVAGIVINTVDDTMHGMKLGLRGMQAMIKEWMVQEYLSKLIRSLLEDGFELYLTSDHGNVECKGMGTLREGSIAKSRGERVRVYPSEELRKRVLQECDFAAPWDSSALPKDYFPVIAKENSAFVKKGETIIGHGGAAMEEVIVPWIKIERNRCE